MNISEAARKFGLSADTLRYYEKIGLMPAVTRKPGGSRDYGEEEFGWVEFVKLMRGAGVEVEALSRYVRLFLEGPSTAGQRKQILIEQRGKIAARIAEMNASLDRLDEKIAHYETSVMPHEDTLAPASASSFRGTPSKKSNI
ncbi:MAG: MerR family transcriptional regulator [Deltaproteobacteria bacterium]|jgi:DNA-binding transcriptional MerR regulator|nr:MerR family transcriptional regulator [Deltaproteobacteria bacterium]